MKFLTVRDITTEPDQILKMLPEEQELVLTNNGKPIALITPLSERNLEETLSAVRKARAQTAVQQIQLASVASGRSVLSLEEIEKEIVDAYREMLPSESPET